MKFSLSITTCLFFCGFSFDVCGQTASSNTENIPVVSTAPVSFRVNESGSKLHGYYKKSYNLTIYGDSLAIGYRADCDKDDDWSGAIAHGTTQNRNSFESKFDTSFNPNTLYGTVLPGNKQGQNHFDFASKLGAGVGDLTITYKLDNAGNVVDSVIGVVFDRGPHNQPGESSVAVCNKFRSRLDDNLFVYIVFPNSVKYLKQVIGILPNGKHLKRPRTNNDFVKAYQLMYNQSSANNRLIAQRKLIAMLSQIQRVTNFDNATPQEKKEAILKPKNDDRNLNE